MPRKHGRERELTDKSLAGERRKTDEELSKRMESVEKDADEVVSKARDRAGEVLARARASADERLRLEGETARAQADVDAERRREDAALARARSAADAKLAEERDERRRAMAELLALEREQTDLHLLREREDADEAVGARDDILGIVSHDLRNLLGGIALSAALLLNLQASEDLRAAISGHAQRIQRNTVRMSRLLADLLDVVSIEAGRLAVTPRRNDATELLRELQESFGPLAAARGITLVTHAAAGSLVARYDHGRILQVLANLVTNAIKFTEEGGRVEIVAEPVEQEIRFVVSDTGRGIAPEHLDVIFDRFSRASTTDAAGVGLGLYISKLIVEAHGGRIAAESRLGEGTTLCFTVPAAVHG